MADWVQCTVTGSGETIFVNLDAASLLSRSRNGTAITLTNGDQHVVDEPMQQLILKPPVRGHG